MVEINVDKKEDYKELLVFVKGQLLLENNNLREITNIYFQSYSEFNKLLSYYFRYNNIKGYYIESKKIIEDDYQETTNKIFVRESRYDDFRMKIFQFAFLCCSEIGDTKWKRWAADCSDIDDAMRVSANLANNGIYHAIYSSSRGGYNIKASDVSISKEELGVQYSKLMKNNKLV